MNTKITKTFEVWHCTDSRFPLKTTRPYGNKHLESLRGRFVDSNSEPYEDQQAAHDEGLGTLEDGFQIEPVGILMVSKKEWVYLWGQGRLQKIRELYEEGWHSGNIDTLVVTGVDPEDRAVIATLENSQRSPNRLNDYYMMEELRKQNKMISYTEIYNLTRIPVGTLKALDKEFGKLPVWAKNAMLKGEITEGVAKEVGKAGTDTQKELKEIFIANDRSLTAADVKEKRQAVQAAVYVDISTSLFPSMNVKEWFSRDDLLRVRECMQTEEDRLVIDELLNQTP